MTDPEAQLKKIRRLEANRTCPNCGTLAPTGLGFNNICVKYSTFVCNDCKSSHQAISHRCKSVSMSTWTMDEVLALTTQKGGGNEIALKTWLVNAPPFGQRYNGGTRPKSGDKIEVYKQFIVDCYEKRLFYGELSPDAIQSSSSPTSPNSIASPQKTSPRSTISPAPQQQQQQQRQSQPVQQQATFDFFNDDPVSFQPASTNSNAGFDAFGTSFSSNTAPSTTNSNQDFGFNAFESSSNTSGFSFMNTPSPVTQQQQQQASNSNFGFNDFNQFSPQQSNSTSYNNPPFSPPVPSFHSSKTAPVTQSAFDFDPFGPASKPTRSTSDNLNVSVGFNQPVTPATPNSSFSDPFGSDILSFQPMTSTSNNNSMQSGYSPSLSTMSTPSSSSSSSSSSTNFNSAMNNNNRAAMAISSIGMSPRGPVNNNGMYPPRGPPANINSFDFVGNAIQSELGRGISNNNNSTGTAMRSSPMMPPQTSPMNSMNMNMGMGMGGMNSMGGGMQSPMSANNGFNISSMGNGMQPRGPAQNNYQSNAFPSNW